MLLACGDADNSSDRTMPTMSQPSGPAADANQIARRIGIALPPAAKVEYASTTAGHDDSARLILVMPEADWTAMKAAPPFAGIDPATFVSAQTFHLGDDEGVWNPRSVPGLIAAQTYLKGQAESLNVGVAPPQGGQVRVYLFWYQL